MSKLKFTILKKKGNARVGQVTLNGVTFTTPAFMPVGTKATIKGLILDMLRDPKYLGHTVPISIILANTFHLYLRPGDQLIKDAGGLHRFENRDQLILTDSGGFQAFSLGLLKTQKSEKPLAKLTEDGVKFRSPYDGSSHFFSPENVVDIQRNFGSDIMMVLDVCSPGGISKKKYYEQLQLTHRWAKRAFDHFEPVYNESRGVLFPIVQGGTYHDLREESLEYLKQFAWDGIAVGGVSVGETREQVYDIMQFVGPKLPEDKPRYLMGVGTPADLIHGINNGFDMFDCVLATRLGRHGTIFSNEGLIKIGNSKYKNDFTSLDPDSDCYTAKFFTKAYLHHLVNQNEMLGGTLLSLYNISYLHNLVEKMKKDILND